jgi:hypothetical protein
LPSPGGGLKKAGNMILQRLDLAAQRIPFALHRLK